jgi:hypothetical protein
LYRIRTIVPEELVQIADTHCLQDVDDSFLSEVINDGITNFNFLEDNYIEKKLDYIYGGLLHKRLRV